MSKHEALRFVHIKQDTRVQKTPEKNQTIPYYLRGSINDQTANQICMDFQHYEREDPKKQIDLHLTTHGGTVDDGLLIAEQIQMIENPVSIIAEGYVMSAGVTILAAGDKGKRKAWENTRFMIHNVSSDVGQGLTDVNVIYDRAKQCQELNDHFLGRLAEFTGKPLEEIKELCKKDYYFDSKKALELGIIDEVMPGKKQKEPKNTPRNSSALL